MNLDTAAATHGGPPGRPRSSVPLIDVYPVGDDVQQASGGAGGVDVAGSHYAGHHRRFAQSRLVASPGLLRVAAVGAATVLAFALGRAQADGDEHNARNPGSGPAVSTPLMTRTGRSGTGQEGQDQNPEQIHAR